MGRQLAHAFDLFESFPKFIPEIGGVARGILLALLPDEFRIDLPKLPCAPAQIVRHGDIPIAANFNFTFGGVLCMIEIA